MTMAFSLRQMLRMYLIQDPFQLPEILKNQEWLLNFSNEYKLFLHKNCLKECFGH